MIVTVVTPTLNAVEFLKECIESVKRQESGRVSVEHIIVDPGSTDGTVELAESYGLRVMKGKDRGIFDAINKGSFNSSGELIGFLGADDELLDGALEEVVRRYEQEGRPWVVGGVTWTNNHGKSLGDIAAPPSWMTVPAFASLGWCCIAHMATYISREFFVKLGGFNIEYKDAGDYELFARALTHHPYSRIERSLACYRRTGANNSVSNKERMNKDIRAVAEKFAPDSVPQRALYRYLMKAWLNGANPSWSTRKWADAAGARVFARLRP